MVIDYNKLRSKRVEYMTFLENHELNLKALNENNFQKEYSNRLADINDLLLTEAVYTMCKKSGINEEFALRDRTIIYNLIKENKGSAAIFVRANKTLFLHELSTLITEYTRVIKEKKEEEVEKTMDLSVKVKNEFLDDLSDLEDMENITKSVADKVASAENEFYTEYEVEKDIIDTAVQDAKDKIANIENDANLTEKDSNALKEHTMQMLKIKVDDLKKDRMRTFYDALVNESVNLFKQNDKPVSKDTIKEAHGLAKSVYIIMEMVNTCKLIRVDDALILKVLDM